MQMTLKFILPIHVVKIIFPNNYSNIKLCFLIPLMGTNFESFASFYTHPLFFHSFFPSSLYESWLIMYAYDQFSKNNLFATPRSENQNLILVITGTCTDSDLQNPHISLIPH